MTMYCFFQDREKTKWAPYLASERASLIKDRKPMLISVLDVDNSFETDLTVDEQRALRYSGPFYIDLDDEEDLDNVTSQLKVLLTNLKAKSVDLNMLRIFCTGKKGYHIEIPQQVFMGKPPANGTQFLPDIYREMAHSIYVETLDTRVYTARRGRLWR